MRILWYWPFARPEELPLACAAVRPGDEITVQVIDRPAAPDVSPCDQVRLVRDLPDVRRGPLASSVWRASRTTTYVRRARRRARLITMTSPDVCHVHYLNRFTDWFVPRTGHIPLVISVHDVVPHNKRLPAMLEHSLLGATYRRADALVVHHESLKRSLVAAYAVDERRVHVIPHQVFAYAAEPVPLPAEPCLLVFGALRHNKGIDVFLDAVAATSGNAQFVIAGRGEPSIEKQLTRAAERDPRIQIELGHIPQARKIELFQRASVVVLPYTAFASQSGVLHDAYAHGRPVVVTDVGALGDSVREDVTGVVVAPGDADALGNAMMQLVGDRRALEDFASNALSLRAARSPSMLGPALRRVYDEISR